MKIWRLEIDFGEYESFQLVNKDKQFLREFKNKILSGKPQNGELDNMEIEIVEGEIATDLPKFWSASGTMLFSEKSKNCLESLISDCVELIPIKYQNTTIYMINILCLTDTIDYSNAILKKLDSGLVVGVESYSFVTSKIQDFNMFKLMLNGRIYSTEIFVTSEFKTRVEENKLLGFKFVEVWDSNS